LSIKNPRDKEIFNQQSAIKKSAIFEEKQ